MGVAVDPLLKRGQWMDGRTGGWVDGLGWDGMVQSPWEVGLGLKGVSYHLLRFEIYTFDALSLDCGLFYCVMIDVLRVGCQSNTHGP